MTDHPATEYDQTDRLTDAVLAERGGPTRFSIEGLAILQAYVQALSDRDADAIAKLGPMLPPVAVRRVEVEPEVEPELTLEQIDAVREWDLSKLSTLQLWQLEEITACATGAAVPLWSERLAAAVELVRLVDLAGDVRSLAFNRENFVVAIRTMVERIISPTPVDVIWPSYQVEAESTRARLAVLEAALDEARSANRSNVVKFSGNALAESQAPIVRASNIDTLSPGPRHLGDRQ